MCVLLMSAAPLGSSSAGKKLPYDNFRFHITDYINPAPLGHWKPREINRNTRKQAKMEENWPWNLLEAFLVPPVSQMKGNSYIAFPTCLVIIARKTKRLLS